MDRWLWAPLVFWGLLGSSVPTGLLEVAAGPFVQMGALAWKSALVTGLVAVIVGDFASHALGRPTPAQGPGACRSGGAPAVLAMRVLFTSPDVPANLIAGGGRLRVGRLLALDVIGWTA